MGSTIHVPLLHTEYEHYDTCILCIRWLVHVAKGGLIHVS